MGHQLSRIEVEPFQDSILSLEVNYGQAADALRKGEVRYAQAFQLAKYRGAATDGHAHQIAIEETQGELTTLRVALDVERLRLERRSRNG